MSAGQPRRTDDDLPPVRRPPGQRRARQPRTPGKILVELTLPQLRVLFAAAVAHDTVLDDRCEPGDPDHYPGAVTDRATLNRAIAALAPHIPETR